MKSGMILATSTLIGAAWLVYVPAYAQTEQATQNAKTEQSARAQTVQTVQTEQTAKTQIPRTLPAPQNAIPQLGALPQRQSGPPKSSTVTPMTSPAEATGSAIPPLLVGSALPGR
jgi:hypothetical protein